jgi:hypothetical protein
MDLMAMLKVDVGDKDTPLINLKQYSFVRTLFRGCWKCLHAIGTLSQSNNEWTHQKEKTSDRVRGAMLHDLVVDSDKILAKESSHSQGPEIRQLVHFRKNGGQDRRFRSGHQS